jgi:molybdate transport repressor ModE-like protein
MGLPRHNPPRVDRVQWRLCPMLQSGQKMPLHLVPRSLLYLEKVAEFGSIQAASKELGISASAIHRQITSLEDTIGELLFERTPKGMVITPQGQLLLDLALSWRLESARTWTTIQENRGIEHGRVKVAAMDGMVNGLVPAVLFGVTQRLPQVQIEIDILSPDNAVKGVLLGEYDFAMVANAPPDKNLIFHWKEDFPLGCIAAPTHPVAAKNQIYLEEFISYPVVFQSKYISIRKHLEARHGWIFEKAKRAIVANSPQLIKVLAASGDFIALTSALDADTEIKEGKLCFIPVGDENALQQTISVISNAHSLQTELNTTVLTIAVQEIQSLTENIPSRRMPS